MLHVTDNRRTDILDIGQKYVQFWVVQFKYRCAFADPDNSIRGVGLIFLVISVFHGGPYGPTLVKQLDPMGPAASKGESVPVFLNKHIATCDYQ